MYKNRVNPDQLASADASLSGSTLFSKDGIELRRSYIHSVPFRSTTVYSFTAFKIIYYPDYLYSNNVY